MVFAENEAKVRGVVTYPGGDRVDWKQIDLPEGKKGRLDLQMTYTTPVSYTHLTLPTSDLV